MVFWKTLIEWDLPNSLNCSTVKFRIQKHLLFNWYRLNRCYFEWFDDFSLHDCETNTELKELSTFFRTKEQKKLDKKMTKLTRSFRFGLP